MLGSPTAQTCLMSSARIGTLIIVVLLGWDGSKAEHVVGLFVCSDAEHWSSCSAS